MGSCTLTALTCAYKRQMIFRVRTDGREASGSTLGYAHNNSGALIPAEVVMLLPPSPLYEHYLEIGDAVVLTVIFSLLIKIEVITLDE